MALNPLKVSPISLPLLLLLFSTSLFLPHAASLPHVRSLPPLPPRFPRHVSPHLRREGDSSLVDDGSQMEPVPVLSSSGTIRSTDSDTKETETLSGEYSETFEVLREVEVPAGVQACHVAVMTWHLFGNLPPPFEGEYAPPKECGNEWSAVVLKWSARVRGRQFDRIGDVYFDDLHMLRTTTEEPSATGIRWSFEVDVTSYAPFLKKNRFVSVYVGNVVDSTYTGVYNVSVSLSFYPGKPPSQYADVIIPIGAVSKGYAAWGLTKGADTGSKNISGLPKNIFRAELEITQSQTANDEFYWGNVPDSYIASLPLEDQSAFLGGGTFRETQVFLDDQLAGATWQTPPIYTGGVNPYYWRPVVGIGAFAVPKYTVDLTPFSGILGDGGRHVLGLKIEGVVEGGVWFVDGTLHLWLDEGREETKGKVTRYEVASTVPVFENVSFYPNNLDANITTKAERLTKISGFIETSFGNVTSYVENRFSFYNFNRILNNAFHYATTQYVKTSTRAIMKTSDGKILFTREESYDFPFYIDLEYYLYPDGVNFQLLGSFDHGFNFKKSSFYIRNYLETQKNVQSGGGVYDTSVPGWGKSKQLFSYKSNFQGCYFRAYDQANYTFQYDNISKKC